MRPLLPYVKKVENGDPVLLQHYPINYYHPLHSYGTDLSQPPHPASQVHELPLFAQPNTTVDDEENRKIFMHMAEQIVEPATFQEMKEAGFNGSRESVHLGSAMVISDRGSSDCKTHTRTSVLGFEKHVTIQNNMHQIELKNCHFFLKEQLLRFQEASKNSEMFPW